MSHKEAQKTQKGLSQGPLCLETTALCILCLFVAKER